MPKTPAQIIHDVVEAIKEAKEYGKAASGKSKLGIALNEGTGVVDFTQAIFSDDISRASATRHTVLTFACEYSTSVLPKIFQYAEAKGIKGALLRATDSKGRTPLQVLLKRHSAGGYPHATVVLLLDQLLIHRIRLTAADLAAVEEFADHFRDSSAAQSAIAALREHNSKVAAGAVPVTVPRPVTVPVTKKDRDRAARDRAAQERDRAAQMVGGPASSSSSAAPARPSPAASAGFIPAYAQQQQPQPDPRIEFAARSTQRAEILKVNPELLASKFFAGNVDFINLLTLHKNLLTVQEVLTPERRHEIELLVTKLHNDLDTFNASRLLAGTPYETITQSLEILQFIYRDILIMLNINAVIARELAQRAGLTPRSASGSDSPGTKRGRFGPGSSSSSSS